MTTILCRFLSLSLLCKLIYFAGCRRAYTASFARSLASRLSCERRENLKYQDFRVKRYEYIKFSLFFSFFSIACQCISYQFCSSHCVLYSRQSFSIAISSPSPNSLFDSLFFASIATTNKFVVRFSLVYLPFYVCRHFYFRVAFF